VRAGGGSGDGDGERHGRRRKPAALTPGVPLAIRGPSYQIRGVLGETTGGGKKITLAIAKGKNGKKFRTLGKAKVNSQGCSSSASPSATAESTACATPTAAPRT
jgi:hypothetical protein